MLVLNGTTEELDTGVDEVCEVEELIEVTTELVEVIAELEEKPLLEFKMLEIELLLDLAVLIEIELVVDEGLLADIELFEDTEVVVKIELIVELVAEVTPGLLMLELLDDALDVELLMMMLLEVPLLIYKVKRLPAPQISDEFPGHIIPHCESGC